MGKRLSQLESIANVDKEHYLLIDGEDLLQSKKAKLKDINLSSFKNDLDIPTVDIKVDGNFNPNSDNPQSGKAVAEALAVAKDYTNAKIDQTYTPDSENAQSGKAVAEAVSIERKRVGNTFANALKGTKSDTAILLADISPVTHEMGVKVRGKNLIPYPYPNSTQTINGVTFTVNSDGTITANGTATSNAYLEITSISTFYIPKGNYILSGCPSGGSSTTYSLAAVNGSGISYTKFRQDIGNGITLSSSGEYWIIRCQVMAGQTVENLTFKLQLELGTTATAYTPYVDVTKVKVSRYGKNLFDKNSTIDGYEITNVTTGDISVNKDWFVTDYILVVEGYTYKVSGKDRGSSVLFYDKDKKFLGYNASDGNGTFTVIKNACYVVLNGLLTQKETFQLELGSTATDYEPYIAPTEFTPTADGTVNGVTSLYPNTTLMSDTEGVIIDCEYNRDLNKSVQDVTVDQTYSPTSNNAQSGKAVAEAVADKEFELIEEITITEDTDVITRNMEPDGTAYNFSGIFAIVSFPAMTNDYNKVGVTMYLYDENNRDVFGDRIRRDNQPLSQYSRHNWLPIGVLNVKGIQIPYVGQITTNRYYGYPASLLSDPVFNKKFTKVTFTEVSSVSKQFIAGTKISIYGVR